jgi:glycosidase
MNLLRRSILAALLTVSFSAVAQQSTPYTASFTQQAPAAAPQDSAAAPRILKIDPPNWWAQMPKPMLLVRGENLTSAKVRLSDPHLKIESTRISENGHWAELWLNASPASPETVQITIKTPSGTTSAPFKFDKKRSENDGFAGFSSADVMYLIMTDRFADGDLTNDGTPAEHAAELAKPRGWHGGDLRGIQQHIDYLQNLGITTVWITPVYQNHGAQSYHGYGATDMYSVDEHFGSLKDLENLCQTLHDHHMKLVLDTVPNHVGASHPWVYDSPEPTWFHGTAAHHTVAQSEFKPLTDPHAPWRDQRDVLEGWFANTLPDLNQENPTVARYLIQNAIWWTEVAGLDGLRIDTFPYVARPFWHDFHTQLHGLHPHFTTVGEVFNPDPTITSSFAGGVTRNGVDTGLDTPFDFPTYFALRETLLHNAPMTKLADGLRLDALFPHPERLVPFLGNHDTTRFFNDPNATPQKLQLAFTLLTTMRGMPQIYSGDEIAMRGGEDPDNRRDFPGGFPSVSGQPQAQTFPPENLTPEQRQTFDNVKALLAIRRSHPALQDGEEQVLHADNDTLVYVRSTRTPSGGTQRVLIALNKGIQSENTSLDITGTTLNDTRSASMLVGDSNSIRLADHKLILRVAPESAVIATIE